jgi:hypothetical protein
MSRLKNARHPLRCINAAEDEYIKRVIMATPTYDYGPKQVQEEQHNIRTNIYEWVENKRDDWA